MRLANRMHLLYFKLLQYKNVEITCPALKLSLLTCYRHEFLQKLLPSRMNVIAENI